MRVTFCGVRGSTPAPGPEFVRYGGHTSCVAVAHDGQPPSLVLDAGTGIRRVFEMLGGESFRGSMLLGHLHWDHVQGLPFFRCGDDEDAEVSLYLPDQGDDADADAETLFERFMSPPFFPIPPSGLRGNWRFETLKEGEHSLEGFTVTAREIPHKGGRTLGFRISDGSATIAYLSDHHPSSLGPGPSGFGELHDAAVELGDGVDLLIHDAQYTVEEFALRSEYGHPVVDYAVELAQECEVGHLALFHHDPAHTDDEIDAIVAGLPATDFPVTAAVEGWALDLPEVGQR